MGFIILVAIIMLISFALFCYFFRNKNGIPTNWPLVGMLPSLLINIHRLNEFCIELMEKSNLTFLLKGPWLANMNFMFTVDPTNIQHVLSKSFNSYVKGDKLTEILDPLLGDGIFNTDSILWNYHRNVAHSFFHHSKFHHSLLTITWGKIENGLTPIFDDVSDRGVEIDLQDIFLRFMYDTMSILMMNHDPMSLSVDMPDFPIIKAITDMMRVAVSRHVVPNCVWKLQRWLNVGAEKQLKHSCKILDDFIYKCIDRKKKEKIKGNDPKIGQHGRVDLLSFIMDDKDENTKPPIEINDKFLKDTMSNFFLAGGETTSIALSWFFYLLSKHPLVVHRIREELDSSRIIMKDSGDDDDDEYLRKFEEVNSKLVYLHAALCESLRLYPSAVFNPKTPTKPDILPSGHQVDPNTQILIPMYAMGRMKLIWGDDCNEFKPERWITKCGMIKHEPSYKFSVFGSGPRSCVGKQMAFILVKVIASFIIQNYHIEVLGKDQVPDVSIVLYMKDEFKVRVYRSTC